MTTKDTYIAQRTTFINHFLMGYCRTKECVFYSELAVQRGENFCRRTDPYTGREFLDTLMMISSKHEEKVERLAEHQTWEVRDRKKVEDLFAQHGFRFRDGYSFESLTMSDTFNPEKVIEPINQKIAA